MSAKKYLVKIWKTWDRSTDNREGEPDFSITVDALSAEDALKSLLKERRISGMFHAEIKVDKTDDARCWVYNDTSL